MCWDFSAIQLVIFSYRIHWRVISVVKHYPKNVLLTCTLTVSGVALYVCARSVVTNFNPTIVWILVLLAGPKLVRWGFDEHCRSSMAAFYNTIYCTNMSVFCSNLTEAWQLRWLTARQLCFGNWLFVEQTTSYFSNDDTDMREFSKKTTVMMLLLLCAIIFGINMNI